MKENINIKKTFINIDKVINSIKSVNRIVYSLVNEEVQEIEIPRYFNEVFIHVLKENDNVYVSKEDERMLKSFFNSLVYINTVDEDIKEWCLNYLAVCKSYRIYLENLKKEWVFNNHIDSYAIELEYNEGDDIINVYYNIDGYITRVYSVMIRFEYVDKEYQKFINDETSYLLEHTMSGEQKLNIYDKYSLVTSIKEMEDIVKNNKEKIHSQSFTVTSYSKYRTAACLYDRGCARKIEVVDVYSYEHLLKNIFSLKIKYYDVLKDIIDRKNINVVRPCMDFKCYDTEIVDIWKSTSTSEYEIRDDVINSYTNVFHKDDIREFMKQKINTTSDIELEIRELSRRYAVLFDKYFQAINNSYEICCSKNGIIFGNSGIKVRLKDVGNLTSSNLRYHRFKFIEELNNGRTIKDRDKNRKDLLGVIKSFLGLPYFDYSEIYIILDKTNPCNGDFLSMKKINDELYNAYRYIQAIKRYN